MKKQGNEIVEAQRSASGEAPGQLGLERLDSSDRSRRISEAAYQRAEARGFTPGAELDDWLAAESEIDGSGRAGDRPDMPAESSAQQRKTEEDAIAQRSAQENSARQGR